MVRVYSGLPFSLLNLLRGERQAVRVLIILAITCRYPPSFSTTVRCISGGRV